MKGRFLIATGMFTVIVTSHECQWVSSYDNASQWVVFLWFASKWIILYHIRRNCTNDPQFYHFHQKDPMNILGTTSVPSVILVQLLPWTKKKEPSPRFVARKTLFHVWYHARSAQGKSRGQSWIGLCPALIARDWAWYHTWNSVLLATDLEEGSFFCPGKYIVRRQ